MGKAIPLTVTNVRTEQNDNHGIKFLKGVVICGLEAQQDIWIDTEMIYKPSFSVMASFSMGGVKIACRKNKTPKKAISYTLWDIAKKYVNLNGKEKLTKSEAKMKEGLNNLFREL